MERARHQDLSIQSTNEQARSHRLKPPKATWHKLGRHELRKNIHQPPHCYLCLHDSSLIACCHPSAPCTATSRHTTSTHHLSCVCSCHLCIWCAAARKLSEQTILMQLSRWNLLRNSMILSTKYNTIIDFPNRLIRYNTIMELPTRLNQCQYPIYIQSVQLSNNHRWKRECANIFCVPCMHGP